MNTSLMKAGLSRQCGIGMLHLFYLIATFGLLLLIAFKIVPPYHENWYVEKALRQLAQNHPGDLQTLSKSSISSELGKFYTINNVRNSAITEALEVDRRREKTVIRVAYEARVPVVANIDVVVKFNNVLDSSDPDACCKPSPENEKAAKK